MIGPMSIFLTIHYYPPKTSISMSKMSERTGWFGRCSLPKVRPARWRNSQRRQLRRGMKFELGHWSKINRARLHIICLTLFDMFNFNSPYMAHIWDMILTSFECFSLKHVSTSSGCMLLFRTLVSLELEEAIQNRNELELKQAGKVRPCSRCRAACEPHVYPEIAVTDWVSALKARRRSEMFCLAKETHHQQGTFVTLVWAVAIVNQQGILTTSRKIQLRQLHKGIWFWGSTVVRPKSGPAMGVLQSTNSLDEVRTWCAWVSSFCNVMKQLQDAS